MNTAAMELRSAYPRTMSTALGTSGLIHLAILSLCVVIWNNEPAVRDRTTTVTPIDITRLFLDHRDIAIHPTVAVHRTTADLGHMIPIPETSLDPAIDVNNTVVAGSTGNAVGGEIGTDEGGSGEGTMDGSTTTGTIEDIVEPFNPGIEKLPVPVSAPAPLYPDIARRAGLEGSVYVKVLVGNDGKVRSAEIAKSTNELFNDAALESARRWTFTPAVMANRTVSVWMTLPFRFRLAAR